MLLIKFCGKDKKECIRKAFSFYYDNYDKKEMTHELFFAKCRLQDDKKTIHFYPKMDVDIKKIREIKKAKKNGKK
jgi:hypothetical protein